MRRLRWRAAVIAWLLEEFVKSDLRPLDGRVAVAHEAVCRHKCEVQCVSCLCVAAK